MPDELRVHLVNVERYTTGAALEIAFRIRDGAHRASPDDLPADIRRALLRWLGYIDTPGGQS